MSYQLNIEPLGASLEVEDDQTILDACITTLTQGRLDIYPEKFLSAADARQVRSPVFKKI